MQPGNTDVIHGRHCVSEYLRRCARLFRNRYVGRSCGNDQDFPACLTGFPAPSLGRVQDDRSPYGIMVSSAVETQQGPCDPWIHSRGQHRMPMPPEARGDSQNLRLGFPFAKDGLRHALAKQSMVIYSGKADVFIRKSLQVADSRLHTKPTFLHILQQAPDAIQCHVRSNSCRAARSISSETARAGSLSSNSTAHTSRTMGISTRCRSAKASATRAVLIPSATVWVLARIAASFLPSPS